MKDLLPDEYSSEDFDLYILLDRGGNLVHEGLPNEGLTFRMLSYTIALLVIRYGRETSMGLIGRAVDKAAITAEKLEAALSNLDLD